MAETAGSIVWLAEIDTSKLDSGLASANKRVKDTSENFKDLDKNLSKSGTSIGDIAKGSLLGVGAFNVFQGAVQSVGSVISRSIEEFKAAELATSNLNSVVAQTNKAFGRGLNTDDIKAFATELQNSTGIADDAIIQSSAVLASFGGVTKSNFNQATEAAANLSTLLGTDMQSATLQLGKALENPEKGLQALTRSGVSFSEQQKAQILAMQASGDMAGAQGKIIEAVYNNTGDAARKAGETATGQLNILRERINGVKETIGGFVVNKIVLPGIDLIIGSFKTLLDTVTAIKTAVSDFFEAVSNGNAPAVLLASALAAIATPLTIMAIQSGLAAAGQLALAAASTASSVAMALASAAGTAFGAVLAFLTSPLFLITAGILAVIAIGYLLIKHWDTVKAFATTAWNAVKDAVSTAVNSAKSFISNLSNAISNFVSSAINRLGDFRNGVVNAVLGTISAVAGLVGRFVSIGGDIIRGIADGIANSAGAIKDAIKNAIGNVVGFAKGLLGIKSPSRLMADQIGGPISDGIAQGITNSASGVSDALGGVLSNLSGTANIGANITGLDNISSINGLKNNINLATNTKTQVIIKEPIFYDSLNILTQEQKRTILKDLLDASNESIRANQTVGGLSGGGLL